MLPDNLIVNAILGALTGGLYVAVWGSTLTRLFNIDLLVAELQDLTAKLTAAVEETNANNTKTDELLAQFKVRGRKHEGEWWRDLGFNHGGSSLPTNGAAPMSSGFDTMKGFKVPVTAKIGCEPVYYAHHDRTVDPISLKQQEHPAYERRANDKYKHANMSPIFFSPGYFLTVTVSSVSPGTVRLGQDSDADPAPPR